jgi:hypothetical protein
MHSTTVQNARDTNFKTGRFSATKKTMEALKPEQAIGQVNKGKK